MTKTRKYPVNASKYSVLVRENTRRNPGLKGEELSSSPPDKRISYDTLAEYSKHDNAATSLSVTFLCLLFLPATKMGKKP